MPALVLLVSCGGKAAEAPAPTPAALDRDGLVAAVTAAIDEHSSVRVESGNLNPPPPSVLEQEYGAAGDDLRWTLTIDPSVPAMTILRTGGWVYLDHGEGFGKIKADDPRLLGEGGFDPGGMGRMLQTSPVEELKATLAAATVVQPLGGGQYRIVVSTATLLETLGKGAAFGLVDEALPVELTGALWVGADSLPVRLELKYSDGVAGVEGTGTLRNDYSDWGDGIDVEAPADAREE